LGSGRAKDWFLLGGLLGSGSAKDAFLLGIMIRPSSSEDSSSPDEFQSLLAGLVSFLLLTALGVGSSSSLSASVVVSARARPCESIVNFTDVFIFGVMVSGMELRLDKRWWFLRGDVLPLAREP
jgi:hypothetical protein